MPTERKTQEGFYLDFSLETGTAVLRDYYGEHTFENIKLIKLHGDWEINITDDLKEVRISPTNAEKMICEYTKGSSILECREKW